MNLYVLKQQNDEYIVDRIETNSKYEDFPIIFDSLDDVYDMQIQFKEATQEDANIFTFDFEDLKEFENIKFYSTAHNIFTYMPKFQLFAFIKALDEL